MHTALNPTDRDRTLEAMSEHRLDTAHTAADKIQRMVSQLGTWEARLLDGLGLEAVAAELRSRVESFHGEMYAKLEGMTAEDRERMARLRRQLDESRAPGIRRSRDVIRAGDSRIARVRGRTPDKLPRDSQIKDRKYRPLVPNHNHGPAPRQQRLGLGANSTSNAYQYLCYF